jgi:hypothetical protein
VHGLRNGSASTAVSLSIFGTIEPALARTRDRHQRGCSTAAQAFAEGNKRTALLLARWVLDHNGIDGAKILPADDEVLADLLVKAVSGLDVEAAVLELFVSRS